MFYHPHTGEFIFFAFFFLLCIFLQGLFIQQSFEVGVDSTSFISIFKCLKKIADFNSLRKTTLHLIIKNCEELQTKADEIVRGGFDGFTQMSCASYFLLYDYIWSDYIYFNFSHATVHPCTYCMLFVMEFWVKSFSLLCTRVIRLIFTMSFIMYEVGQNWMENWDLSGFHLKLSSLENSLKFFVHN